MKEIWEINSKCQVNLLVKPGVRQVHSACEFQQNVQSSVNNKGSETSGREMREGSLGFQPGITTVRTRARKPNQGPRI